MSKSEIDQGDGLPIPRRYWSILAIALALAMMVVDSSLSSIALPTIAHELHASDAASIWVINAFQIAMIISLLPMAALGESIGYRWVYLAGMPIFALGALAASLSDSMTMLTIARCFEGIGAACFSSCNSAIVRFTYPADQLGRGIGLNAMIIAVFSALGPPLASLILSIAPWQWLFAANVPFAVLAFALGLWALPRTAGSHRAFDLISAGLNALTWGGLLLGASSLAHGATPIALGELAIGAIAATLLAMRELKKPSPLVPFDLLRIRIFRLSVATGIVSFIAQMLSFIAIPFYFQKTLGLSVVTTGAMMTPWAIASGFSANAAGRLSDRYPPSILGAIGLGVMAVGLVLVALITPDTASWDILWRMAVTGAGFGFFQTPNNRALIMSSPRERSGAAGAMLSTTRLIGQTIGAALMVMLFQLLPNTASQVGLVLAGGVSLLAAGVSLTRLKEAPVGYRP